MCEREEIQRQNEFVGIRKIGQQKKKMLHRTRVEQEERERRHVGQGPRRCRHVPPTGMYRHVQAVGVKESRRIAERMHAEQCCRHTDQEPHRYS